MVFEFLGALGLSPKDKKMAQVASSEKGRCQKSEAYARLKVRFGDGALKDGIKQSDLTVGDMVDILHVYLTAVEGGTDKKTPVIARIVKVGRDVTQLSPAEQEEIRLLELSRTDLGELHRDNPVYQLPVDLHRATMELDPAMHTSVDLHHMNGGIMITRRFQEEDDPSLSRYDVNLTNRRGSDNGKGYINDVFQEIPLPVVSSIK